MSKQRVLIELKSTKPISRASVSAEIADAALETKPLPAMAGVDLDPSFPITSVPGLKAAAPAAAGARASVPDLSDAASTFVVRGEIEEKDYNKVMETASVVGVYSDVGIQPCAVCPSGPVGTDLDVERVLCASRLHNQGMDGAGVTVAIVDTGVNMA